MITNKSRSFFLNELDGFETNTGIVVLATTNHPERLDPAILDRPSRFDRKYYFQRPAQAERQAYIARWNTELQSELRLTETGVTDLVKDTDGFSFAYIKEVFGFAPEVELQDDSSYFVIFRVFRGIRGSFFCYLKMRSTNFTKHTK